MKSEVRDLINSMGIDLQPLASWLIGLPDDAEFSRDRVTGCPVAAFLTVISGSECTADTDLLEIGGVAIPTPPIVSYYIYHWDAVDGVVRVGDAAEARDLARWAVDHYRPSEEAAV